MGYIIFTQPAIPPLYESRSDVEIIYELAARLGLDDPLFKAGYEASVDWILEPSGISVAELKKHPGGMFVPNPMKPPEKKYLKAGFKTPSGRMEFKSKVLEKYEGRPGFEALPVYTPPKHSKESTPELAQEYPFILNTGSRLPMYVHTRTFRLHLDEQPAAKPSRGRYQSCRCRPPGYQAGRRDPHLYAKGCHRCKSQSDADGPAGCDPHVPRSFGGRRQRAF